MKILTFWFLFCGAASATSYAPLDFPPEPTPAQVLEKSGFAIADEETLLMYLHAHWEAAGYRLSDVTKREQEAISSEFFRRVEVRDVEAEAYLKSARAQLQIDRLADPRRIVDATIRELGRRGTGDALLTLLVLPRIEEREWVCWKGLASVQEILTRTDPTQLDDRIMIKISAHLVAPLLRDLDADVANLWAWTLWERQTKLLGTSTFRSHVRLRSRLWLAQAFAASHPQEAAEVFGEGLRSQDPALRVTTEMNIRSGIGGSLPCITSAEQLSKSFLTSKWNSATPLWETLPLPLDRPLLRILRGGRTDLIWLSGDARIAKSTEDVWPLIREPLVNGHFYSRIGDFRPIEYGLSDSEGILHSRIRDLYPTPIVASHGGLWAVNGENPSNGHNRVAEIHADGSVLWECQLDEECGAVVPISGGRVVLLSRKFIECRNRRGDLLWRTLLTSLDDPRYIVPMGDDRFLISCGKSVGWLTRDGKYDPILSNLKSAGWIRYHPTKPWIIFDGGNGTAIVYDPRTKKELGKIDLDDGWGIGKSRSPCPPGYVPE